MKKRIKSNTKKYDKVKILSIFVLVTLIGSLVYGIVGIFVADSGMTPGQAYDKVKSDYVIIVLQCMLGIVCIFMPSVLEKKLKIRIPNMMYVLFIIFLYAAIYLGEVRSFYYNVQYWDMILHTFSGGMLGALGFSVVKLLNDTDRVAMKMSPLFVALFALTFAVFMGVIWEIYEFTFDGVLGLNMQKAMLEDGTPLLGRDALKDTMEDLIVDTLGALVISVIGYISLKYEKKWIDKIEVKKVKG